MSRAHSQLAERQQNSRFQCSDIADVLPLAMLISLVIAAAPADIAPGDIGLSLFYSGTMTGSLHCLTLKITQKLLQAILQDSFHMDIGM